MVVVLHVGRGHRHHRHHGRLRHHHRGQTQLGQRAGAQHTDGTAHLQHRPHPLGRRIDQPGHHQRIGPQAHGEDGGRQGEEHAREQERPHQRFEPGRVGHTPFPWGEQRTERRAQGAHPHHRTNGTRPLVGLGQVGAHEPRLQRCGLPRAERQHAHEEHRERPDLPTEGGNEPADGTEREGPHQAGPPAVASHVARQRHRHQCRPEREGCTARARQPVAVEQLLAQQGHHGHHAREGRLRRHLRGAHRQQCAPLHCGAVGGDGGGHRRSFTDRAAASGICPCGCPPPRRRARAAPRPPPHRPRCHPRGRGRSASRPS